MKKYLFNKRVYENIEVSYEGCLTEEEVINILNRYFFLGEEDISGTQIPAMLEALTNPAHHLHNFVTCVLAEYIEDWDYTGEESTETSHDNSCDYEFNGVKIEDEDEPIRMH